MTAVRRGMWGEPGKVTDHPDIRPPTDVMAITSLPRTIPPPEMKSTRVARGAAPDSRKLGRDAVPTLPRFRSRETPVRRHFTKHQLGRAKVT